MLGIMITVVAREPVAAQLLQHRHVAHVLALLVDGMLITAPPLLDFGDSCKPYMEGGNHGRQSSRVRSWPRFPCSLLIPLDCKWPYRGD